jgi:hypothetical protein
MVRKETDPKITPERSASGSPFRFIDRTAEIQAIFDDCSFNAYRKKQRNTKEKHEAKEGKDQNPNTSV